MIEAQGTSAERHDWLEKATRICAGLIEAHGPSIPKDIRVSIGFPKGSRGKHSIGQCWAGSASADGHAEIFLSPELGLSTIDASEARKATIDVLGVLAHELVHATVGVAAGHKGPFKKLATAIGLEGKMTATVPSAAFAVWAEPALMLLGTFPMGKLSQSGKGKQSTRLLKCECPGCGYVARVTAKWISQAGAPICPIDGSTFECT